MSGLYEQTDEEKIKALSLESQQNAGKEKELKQKLITALKSSKLDVNEDNIIYTEKNGKITISVPVTYTQEAGEGTAAQSQSAKVNQVNTNITEQDIVIAQYTIIDNQVLLTKLSVDGSNSSISTMVAPFKNNQLPQQQIVLPINVIDNHQDPLVNIEKDEHSLQRDANNTTLNNVKMTASNSEQSNTEQQQLHAIFSNKLPSKQKQQEALSFVKEKYQQTTIYQANKIIHADDSIDNNSTEQWSMDTATSNTDKTITLDATATKIESMVLQTSYSPLIFNSFEGSSLKKLSLPFSLSLSFEIKNEENGKWQPLPNGITDNPEDCAVFLKLVPLTNTMIEYLYDQYATSKEYMPNIRELDLQKIKNNYDISSDNFRSTLLESAEKLKGNKNIQSVTDFVDNLKSTDENKALLKQLLSNTPSDHFKALLSHAANQAKGSNPDSKTVKTYICQAYILSHIEQVPEKQRNDIQRLLSFDYNGSTAPLVNNFEDLFDLSWCISRGINDAEKKSQTLIDNLKICEQNYKALTQLENFIRNAQKLYPSNSESTEKNPELSKNITKLLENLSRISSQLVAKNLTVNFDALSSYNNDTTKSDIEPVNFSKNILQFLIDNEAITSPGIKSYIDILVEELKDPITADNLLCLNQLCVAIYQLLDTDPTISAVGVKQITKLLIDKNSSKELNLDINSEVRLKINKDLIEELNKEKCLKLKVLAGNKNSETEVDSETIKLIFSLYLQNLEININKPELVEDPNIKTQLNDTYQLLRNTELTLELQKTLSREIDILTENVEKSNIEGIQNSIYDINIKLIAINHAQTEANQKSLSTNGNKTELQTEQLKAKGLKKLYNGSQDYVHSNGQYFKKQGHRKIEKLETVPKKEQLERKVALTPVLIATNKAHNAKANARITAAKELNSAINAFDKTKQTKNQALKDKVIAGGLFVFAGLMVGLAGFLAVTTPGIGQVAAGSLTAGAMALTTFGVVKLSPVKSSNHAANMAVKGAETYHKAVDQAQDVVNSITHNSEKRRLSQERSDDDSRLTTTANIQDHGYTT